MQSSTISAQEISKLGFPLIAGDLTATASGAHSLLFIGKGRSFPGPEFKGIIISEILPPSDYDLKQGVAILSSPAIKPAMAKILPFFDETPVIFPLGIHTHASVDPSAKLGKNVRIGARAVIQADVILGDQVWIGSGAVIEANAQIGNSTHIHSNVVVGYNCTIGSHCIIHSGTVLGSDGFGFVQSTKEPQQKIPQIGSVVVGDHVEFGANCAIDRATLGNTVIGEGCKFDNFCHVAHNCQIGKHGLFAGGFFISGSSSISDFFTCGGDVVISDHVHIAHHVTLGGRSAVTKDITQPGAYTGYPLEPIKEGLKTIANLRELSTIRKKVSQIMKHLGLKEI